MKTVLDVPSTDCLVPLRLIKHSIPPVPDLSSPFIVLAEQRIKSLFSLFRNAPRILFVDDVVKEIRTCGG